MTREISALKVSSETGAKFSNVNYSMENIKRTVLLFSCTYVLRMLDIMRTKTIFVYSSTF